MLRFSFKKEKRDERFLRSLLKVLDSDIYCSPKFGAKEAAKLAGSSRRKGDKIVLRRVGFDLEQIIALYRVGKMREMVLSGESFEEAANFCGLGRKCALERALSYIVN